MHHIYHTESFILSSRPSGEDSKTLALYTRELGLVYARAQAVRKLSSKLRYVLQDFSRAQIDLVRGKEIWRITTAVPVDVSLSITKNREAEGVLARVFALVVRLCAGEDPNAEVYACLIDMENMLLAASKETTREEFRSIEIFAVARILIALGYLSRTLLPATPEGSISIPEQFSEAEFRKNILIEINRALSETQL